MNRRAVLKFSGVALLNGAVAAGGTAALLSSAGASAPPETSAATPAPTPAREARLLSFMNTHTGDTFADAYWEAGHYVPDAMAAINHVMRDHRTGEVHPIDSRLIDLLHTLKANVGAAAPFQIISGYRSPATNATLAANSNGVATRSLHTQGRAIDIRVAGVPLTRLRDSAIAMQAGGVGFYPGPDFIHVDTGRVRRW